MALRQGPEVSMSITTRNKMTQEDLKRALEALGKSGITVAGDLVLEKNVEYEVNNVESGGIGIQINHGVEAEVVEEVNEGNIVMEEFPVPQALSASRQALSTKLKDLARKGDW